MTGETRPALTGPRPIKRTLRVGRSGEGFAAFQVYAPDVRCFRHQLLLPSPYLVLTKPLRLDIQCQRGASVKIGWKYLDD